MKLSLGAENNLESNHMLRSFISSATKWQPWSCEQRSFELKSV